MRLVLDAEQELLSKQARRFASERSPVSRVRKLRGDPTGFSWELWREMAALGWVGLDGLPFVDQCLIIEAAGRRLMPEPFHTLLLGKSVLEAAGSPIQKDRWHERISSGQALIALACQEPRSRYDLADVSTRATDRILHGEKVQVLDGHQAEALIVSARTSGDRKDPHGITLFLVPRDAPGLRVVPQPRVDGRNAALVSLDGVHGAEILVPPNEGHEILSGVIDRATVALAAEMIGGAAQAFEDTLAYLKTRKQFGVPIGSFQALQHRAARMFIELSIARSAVFAAAAAVDQAPADVPRLASLAKARAGEVFNLIANEGIQMHGGVGVTDEYDIGLYLKRARAADATFGDVAWHRARWAALAGY